MLVAIAPLLLIITLFLFTPVYAQQQTNETNTDNGGGGVDPTIITAAAGGGAAGVIAIVKQLLDQRKNTARDRTTDADAGRFIILVSKLMQAQYLYPYMTVKEILDLPISNNPMSRQTLGQAITAEAELWSVGNQQYWGIPSPQMSVPTATTVEAIKSSTAAPSTQPPPPTNKPPAQQPPKT